MASALIQFAQGDHTDSAGKAVLGAYADFSTVTVTNGNNTGVVSWKIYLLDAPPDSAAFPVGSQPQIIDQAINGTPSTTFTPDVAGTYRVMLEVTDSLGSVDRDIRCFGIPDRRGFVRPPFQGSPEPLPIDLPGVIALDPRPHKPDEQNYGSNQRGWAGNGPVGQLDQFLQQFDDLPHKLVTSSPYTASVTDPPLHAVTVTGSPVFNLPNAPRVGFVIRVVCIGDPVTVTPSGESANISGYASDVLETTEGAVYVYQGSNTWQVLSRGVARSRVLPTGSLANQFPVWNDDDQVWSLSPGSAYYGGVSVLDYLTGSNTMVQAINDAFADTSESARQIFFPPGVYVIDAPITSPVAYKSIVFIPGAVLQMIPQAGDLFTISGAYTQVSGLRIRIEEESSASFNAIKVAGTNTIFRNRVVIEASSDLPNATFMRIGVDQVYVHNMQVVAENCSFLRALHLERDTDVGSQTGAECGYCVVNGFTAELGSPGPGLDKYYDCLIYWKAQSSELHNFMFWGGGRTHFNTAIITVVGHRNILYNPRIFSFGADIGIKTVDHTAEYLQIIGGSLQGRNNGTFLAGSEGISCGWFCGHLKLYGTAISGWDSGVVFHGSHDTPGFFGAVIANNGSQGILIDTHQEAGLYPAGDYPISAFTIHGMYTESVLGQPVAIFAKSGTMQGLSITSCEIGYSSRALKVDPAYGALYGVVFSANRFVGPADQAVTEPHNFSDIFFGPNTFFGTSTLAAGSFAARVTSYLDPKLTGLKLGTSGTHLTSHFSASFSANFADSLTANTFSDLTFSFPGVLPTDTAVVSVGSALASKVGLVFSGWISGADQVVLRAYNISGTDVTSANGTAIFDIWRH